MIEKTRILSLGFSQSNFLIQLYSQILNREDSFEFEVDNYFDLSSNQLTTDISIFHAMHNFSETKIKITWLLEYFVKTLFLRNFWNVLFFEIFVNRGSLKKLVRIVYGYVKQRVVVEKIISPKKYSIYHFHFCVPECLTYMRFLPKEAKVICSFWGSDLLTKTGVKNMFYVKEALERANLITTQSPELKEIIAAKYGRNLISKIECTLFTIDTNIFEAIEASMINKLEQRKVFCEIYSIDVNTKIVTIGYNARQHNNHVEIINALNNLPNRFKKEITVVLPFSYGGNNEYAKTIESTIGKTSGLTFVTLFNFLPVRDLAWLRAYTDIQIHMPISDALSASVMEVMYGGNFVIAASWLPYSPYDNAGIQFFKANDLLQLNAKIEFILDNFEALKQNNLKNKEKIETSFFPDYTSKTWVNLYNKLR